MYYYYYVETQMKLLPSASSSAKEPAAVVIWGREPAAERSLFLPLAVKLTFKINKSFTKEFGIRNLILWYQNPQSPW